MADEAKRHCPIGSTLKHWLCDMRLVVVMEKNRALSVDQCWLQALQFLVYLFNLLSILLRCNGFARIQKAVENQMGTRPPATLTFFGASSALGSALELLLGPITELVNASYCIKKHFLSLITTCARNCSLFLCRIRESNASK